MNNNGTHRDTEKPLAAMLVQSVGEEQGVFCQMRDEGYEEEGIVIKSTWTLIFTKGLTLGQTDFTEHIHLYSCSS